MKTILLTGFEPFGPYEYNPTQQSALDFNGKVFGDREVVGVVLPSVYDSFKSLISYIKVGNGPYAIINTGLCSSAQGFRIESTFRNIMNGKYADANGYAPKKKPIWEGAQHPDSVRAKGPYKRLYELLINEGIPAERSSDADSFICNSLGYSISLATRTTSYNKYNIFVHVPWTTEYADRVTIEPGKMFLSKELYYKGLELLIRNI